MMLVTLNIREKQRFTDIWICLWTRVCKNCNVKYSVVHEQKPG